MLLLAVGVYPESASDSMEEKALAAMKRARKAQTETGHFVQGSDAAKEKMAELREMRGAKGGSVGPQGGTPDQVRYYDQVRERHGGAVRGPNPWLEHVKAYRAKFPHLSYKECLSAAASEYRK